MIDLLQELEKARKGLLDLGLRNRLLNFRLDSKRSIHAYDELPAQVFNVLVEQKKAMRFAPLKTEEKESPLFSDEDAEYQLNQPDESSLPSDAKTRHSDLALQTRLAGNALQNRLLRIETEARTAIEERGANILYLALGFVRWYESDSSEEEHYAPLILMPAQLSRDSAGSKFRLRWTEEDIATNESFVAKLKSDFGINLPRIPEYIEELVPADYFQKVKKIIKSQGRWELVEDIALGFFTFAKLLMYRDLNSEAWPKEVSLNRNPIIRAILTSSPLSDPSPYGEDIYTDDVAALHEVSLVTDADSSQTLAILDALDGRSIAVQGPPGTGKSQTITNIIASALSSGKRVLFLAEKMAALEVVKRRLDLAGLGDGCLELHSYKARKSYVIEKIRETLDAARPKKGDHPDVIERLKEVRNRLNEYAFAMNTPLVNGGITPHQAVGLIQGNRELDRASDPVGMPEAANWTKAQFAENRDHVILLGKHLALVGNPLGHPWRGARIDALLPSDKPRLATLTRDLYRSANCLLNQFLSACGDLNIQLPCTLINADYLPKLLQAYVVKPPSDSKAIEPSIWNDRSGDIQLLVATGIERYSLGKGLLDVVKEGALSTSYQSELAVYKSRSDSRIKYIHKDYRRARKALKNASLKGKLPKSHADAISLLTQLSHYQELTKRIASLNDLGRSAFADEWRGNNSNWNSINRFMEWMNEFLKVLGERSIIPTVFTRLADRSVSELSSCRDAILKCAEETKIALARWADYLGYDFAESFGVDSPMLNLVSLSEKLELALGRIEAVYEWIDYRRERENCQKLGIQTFTELADKGKLSVGNIAREFDLAYGDAVLRGALREKEILRKFNGDSHSHLIENFKTLDKRLIETTKQYLAATLWERMPHPTLGDPAASSMNYLTNQLQRKRGIAPVRELMNRVGDLIIKIKPCFMMSPMSVAQFLPPGSVNFDLLIIDEASQMRPADALGAIARCGQCIIVGDTKQLPPTNFFDKMIGEDADEDVNLSDVESILDAALSPFGGGRTLRWHYRSRHESLIAYSNKAFYDNKLHVFPSPFRQSAELGIIDHFVRDGVYARGGSRKNLNEAAAVADAIMKHSDRCPHQSLGVVALSKAQQEAIQDKLEELRRTHSEYESFFSEEGIEPFFIKNLETVQGDERDVIFISIGYGRDEYGIPHMNFGPVNREGGWRRLNVLITRARIRCEVFHSLKAEDIRIDNLPDAERQSVRGRMALRNYLGYVESGQIEQPLSSSAGEGESIFEEAVADELEKVGMIVHKQVGVANFRIDMAVIDPQKPGRYLLGIECDGATYHSAKSARDRDRLRQEVLEGLGWNIYRIWSLDWIRDREKEMRRLLLAIEKAKGGGSPRGGEPSKNGGNESGANGTTIERDKQRKVPKHPYELVRSIPYKNSSVPKRSPWDPTNPPISSIASVIADIVEEESPIHRSELSKRILEVYGFGRLGDRISNVISRALNHAKNRGKIILKGSFVWRPGMETPPIRNRSGLGMTIQMVPASEIRRAEIELKKIAEDMGGEYLIHQIAHCLGYERFTSQIGRYIGKFVTDSGKHEI